jgi:RNA polymerase sigma factor (sigma-70 family)
MALAQLDAVRKVFDRVRDEANDGDGSLLARYRRERDQDAFGSLVRRHGPMVLGVCRRVLRDAHAADDAFQATFLVLAKKADAVRPPDRLAPWLYGVAYRTALKARGRAFRRTQVEQAYAAEVSNRAPASHDGTDLLPVIDEQLNALPTKYRDPLVLCALHGLNKAEAAERLGLPEGTVSSRLARAREMLRDRLTRRGVIVPAAALGVLLTADTLQAAVPPALAAAGAEVALGSVAVPTTVLALSNEVLRSMMMLKLKTLCAAVVSVALVGGGFGAYALSADEKKPQPVPGDVKKPQPVPGGDKKPQPVPGDPVKNPNEKNGDNNQNGDGNKPKPAPDGEKKPVKVFKNAGKVASVDAKQSTIMVATKGDNGVVERMFKVAPDAKVFVDGKEAKLADVPKNSTAALIIAAGKEGALPTATEVRATGQSFVAVIAKVDASSVTFEGEKQMRVIKSGADTKVTINGKDAKLADLKAGDKVMVTMKADESAALTIASGTKPGDGEKPGTKPGEKPPVKPDLPRNVGQVVAGVDAQANTVSVTIKGRENAVKVAAGAKVTIDGKDAKLADIPKGSHVVFGGQKEGSKEATEVRVTGETLMATVKQQDAGTITLTTPKSEKNPGTDRVLKLSAIQKVTINGKDGKAADLKAGDKVIAVLSADGTSVLSITAGGGEKPSGDKPKPEKEGEDE